MNCYWLPPFKEVRTQLDLTVNLGFFRAMLFQKYPNLSKSTSGTGDDPVLSEQLVSGISAMSLRSILLELLQTVIYLETLLS